MHDTAKYLIHVRIVADGIVERSDVVGAVFGQTEGLLGEELDLRDLQQSSKVGRIDVQIDSERGQSFGELTIATSLDKIETAILAAALETITRVGPCRADLEVTEIEDVRAAKRREIVERAKELLERGFDETILSSEELREEVRQSVRIADISDYQGLPAGPKVVDSDAIIVVEGRSDVLQLLKYGIKNAIAVEGTNVPETVGELTQDRTVTAFLDGDRGGELILKELEQIGDVDYVAFAPPGTSVENLDRTEVMSALREKVPVDMLGDGESESDTHDGSDAVPAGTDGDALDRDAEVDRNAETVAGPDEPVSASEKSDPSGVNSETGLDHDDEIDSDDDVDSEGEMESDDAVASEDEKAEPATLSEHVAQIADGTPGRARFLDGEVHAIDEMDVEAVPGRLESMESPPATIVLGGTLTQRLLDRAASRGVDRIVATALGEFVKQPTETRVLTADQLVEAAAEPAD